MTTVWLNGRLVAPENALVPVTDHGLTVGDGLFETMKVLDGRPFALSRHLAAVAANRDWVGRRVPPLDELRTAVDATIAANQPGVGRVRLTVTGGTGPHGTVRGDGPATVLVVTGPPPAWEPVSRVVTVPWTRNEQGALAGLKTTSYAENVVALARAHEAGADEAVFANTAGSLCEGTGTNVFVVTDARIVTPPLSAGCLAGVTRELLLELHDLAIVEANMPMRVLTECDEAFLTSSTRDVQPIASIDGRSLARCPGELTQRACDAFAHLQASNPDP